MLYWHNPRTLTRPAAVRGEDLPVTVLARLCELREHTLTRRICQEFGLDERRLLYVRWLVEHGRIGEGI